MSTLILGAFEPELTPLREFISAFPTVTLAETGIGITIAAARTALAIDSIKPTSVIFIGSCGTSSPASGLLDIVVGTSTVLANTASATISDSAFFPKGLSCRLPAGEELNATARIVYGDKVTHSAIYSPVAISCSEELGLALALQTGAHYENLELFGVATACAEANVPWIAFSAITNRINQAGHDEWVKNHVSAAQKTAHFTKLFLEKWS